jgi:hypothetical protein
LLISAQAMNIGSASIKPMSMLASNVAPTVRSMGAVSDMGVELTAALQSGDRRRNSSWLISEISSKISRTRV